MSNIKTEDIYNHLKQQDSNIEFYKKKIERLEKQIEDIKNLSTINNSVELNQLLKDSYSKEEIITAYNRMLKYEGIDKDDSILITDTLFGFLSGNHHSLKINK